MGSQRFRLLVFETFELLRRGDLILAAVNVVLSVLVCVIAVWLGFKLTGATAPRF